MSPEKVITWLSLLHWGHFCTQEKWAWGILGQEDSSQGIQVCATDPYLPEHVSYLGPTAIIYVIAHNTKSISILCKTSTLEKSNSERQQAVPSEKGAALHLCRPLLLSMWGVHSPLLHTWDLQADSEEEGQSMDRRTEVVGWGKETTGLTIHQHFPHSIHFP